MRIMFIQPKMNMRPMDTKLKTQMSPSIALLTLAKLTPYEHKYIIINENIDKINYDEHVDLVAITVTVDVLNRAALIAKEFRSRNIKVVAGGIHISAVPDQVVNYFDAICVGMAEKVWPQMLRDLENNCLKKTYKNIGNTRGEDICSPDYDATDKQKYLYSNIISTSRGCPHKCDFCYNSCENFSSNYINRPIADVLKDIQTLGTKHILFIDDNFIGNAEWTREFLLKIRPLGLKWNAAVTTKIINHLDLLDLMKETGCQSLFIGFETINSKSLKSVNKKQNNIMLYESVVKELHSRGIMINASIVFGLEDDDEGIFEATLDWLIKNKIESVTSHILTPFPGTVLYKRMFDSGKIVDFNLSHYDTAHVVFTPEKMTQKQLYNGYIQFYKKFYSTKNIFRRLPVDREQIIPFLLFNFLYRKYGKLTELLSKILPLSILGRIASRFSYKTK